MRSDRLLAILLTLQARGEVTAPELAERLEVSVRTVYRDVDALSSAGVPVYTERGRGGGIRLLAGYKTDATGLTPDEARSLFTFSGRGVFTEDNADRHLRSAFRKLLAALPEERRAEAERVEERILVEPRPWMRRGGERVPWLPLVQDAVLAGERLRLRYQASGRKEPRDYEVDPVGLVVKAGVWYLVAYSQEEPRMYRVGRIRDAKAIGPAVLPADVPSLEDLWDRMRASFERPGGGVRVELVVPRNRTAWVLGICSSELVERPERREHPDQPDHEILTLSFRSETHAWMMLAAQADYVQVVEPPEVRDELVRNAKMTLRRYG